MEASEWQERNFEGENFLNLNSIINRRNPALNPARSSNIQRCKYQSPSQRRLRVSDSYKPLPRDRDMELLLSRAFRRLLRGQQYQSSYEECIGLIGIA